MANPTDALPYPKNTRSREETLLGAIAGLNEIPDYPIRTMTRKEMYLKYIAEHRGGEGKVEIAINGDSGTLTDEQIALIKSNTTDAVLVNNGKVFYLADKLSTLTYRTYLNLDVADSEAVTAKAIYIQLNEEAVNYGRWTVEDVTIGGTPSASDLDAVIDGTGDIVVDLDAANDTLLIGTHAKTVEITGVPATATEGTFTEEQLAALLESEKSVIKFNNEIYILNDNGHEAGIRGYSHSGVENSVFMLKNITVTLSTGGWVLTTQEVSGGPTIVQEAGDSTTMVMSQAAATKLIYRNAFTRSIIQMGVNSYAIADAGIGIGSSARVDSQPGAIALGLYATAKGKGGVAIGAYSKAEVAGKFDIGSTNTDYGYNSTNYRLLTGVHDGISAHDALTVGQANALIDAINSAMNTSIAHIGNA